MNFGANYSMPPRRRRSCVLIPLLIGAGIVIGIRIARERRQSQIIFAEPATIPLPYIPQAPTVPAPMPAPPRSASDIDPSDTLLADTYPSRQAAVRALAVHLPDMVAHVSDDPGDFRMTFEDLPETGASAYDAIRQAFPRALITMTEPGSKASGNDIVIGLVTEPQSPTSKPASRGTVQITVNSATRSAALSTKFVTCSWADDLADYVNRHPGRNWIVIRSGRLCPSAAEARRAAEDIAVQTVQDIFARQSANRPWGNAVSPIVIRQQLPVFERFVQKFKRPYGDVWSEAILLDASPAYLAGLQQHHNQFVMMRQTRVRTTFASLAIVLVSILLTYAFANAITRSYFTGRLRTVAILVAMVAVSAAALVIMTVA